VCGCSATSQARAPSAYGTGPGASRRHGEVAREQQAVAAVGDERQRRSRAHAGAAGDARPVLRRLFGIRRALGQAELAEDARDGFVPRASPGACEAHRQARRAVLVHLRLRAQEDEAVVQQLERAERQPLQGLVQRPRVRGDEHGGPAHVEQEEQPLAPREGDDLARPVGEELGEVHPA
jgi:hypothetical protein